jgi:hypothetical protein
MSSTPNLGSASENWLLTDENSSQSASLVVHLRRRSLVLPYCRFLYAEGNNAQVQIAFASHLITVTGHGLASLLTALAARQALRLIQPAESDVKVDNPESNMAKHASLVISKIAIEPFQ